MGELHASNKNSCSNLSQTALRVRVLSLVHEAQSGEQCGSLDSTLHSTDIGLAALRADLLEELSEGQHGRSIQGCNATHVEGYFLLTHHVGDQLTEQARRCAEVHG